MLLVLRLAILVFWLGSAAAQEESEYRVGPEDILQIQVLGRADLTGTAAVGIDGKLRIPAIGEVQAADRTTEDLGQELSRRFLVVDPGITQVQVSVSQYVSRSVTVVGEVRSPGRFPFRTIPSLWDVLINNAGGPTPAADLARVEVVRTEPGAGEPKIIRIDLSRWIDGTDPAAIPALRPRDTINVPSQTAGAIATGETFQVLGAVRTPGKYRLTVAATAVEALAASGGPLPEANLAKVQLTRPTSHGVVAYRLDMEGHLFHGKPAGDLALKSGDTLTIPSRGSSFASAITTVLPFLTVFASLLVTYETLSRD
jgi:polysaccharide export outer membrane protein